jgi:hypothetical protein
VHLAYTYNHPVAGGGAPGHASFNGGHGGVQVRPTAAQLTASREQHVMPIGAQRDLVNSASHDQRARANFNHGHPGVAATVRPEASARPGGEAARVPEHGAHAQAHAQGGAGPAREAPQGRPPAVHGAAPDHGSRPQSNAHAAPSFTPREHVPTAPRGEAHAAPHAQPNGEAHASPHGGNAHASAPHAAEQHGGGGDSGKGDDRQHPPRR